MQNNIEIPHKTVVISEQQIVNPQIDDKSYWEMMIDGIVRPPRAKYRIQQLGNKVITYKQKIYIRNDRTVLHEDKNIQLTIYQSDMKKNIVIPYIVLYMHGNSSCRLQALGLIRNLPKGISLACFDFMGCGKNQQINTVTLGIRQASQAKTITQYLTKQGYRVILWGRSMGAASALLYGQSQFIVADSSFKSFKSLCKQVAKQHTPVIIPNCMINCFFPCVFSKMKKDIDKKAHYDVQQLDIRQAVKNLNPNSTVVFLSGNHDILVNKRNSQKLYDACRCNKKYIKIFEGDHNSKRPENVMVQVMNIIQNHIKINSSGPLFLNIDSH